MTFENTDISNIITPQAHYSEERYMLSRELWEEIRRVRQREGWSVSALARRFDLDRKTIRRCLRAVFWQPYQHPGYHDTLLTPYAEWLQQRAPQVHYSARILYQELRGEHRYRGGYDTVKRFVAPLRAVRAQAERALTRFETPPGWRSQIDWGQAQVYFRHRPVTQHLFVLTLGFSRRGFYCAFPDERPPLFLEAHERAFECFGGHTREHLYDRPRTVCQPSESGQAKWNPTFKAFAECWGFEPRLCRAYRAQTKGKVESGVKYVKRNFLPGRGFIDQADFDAQLTEWMASIADTRLHGTTHERPIDRFVRERERLSPATGQPRFRLQARAARIVAEDYLVSFETNRYSVPFTLIGQIVEIERRGDTLCLYHRGKLVATHPVLPVRHQLVILPEHGPGAIARNTRQRRSSPTTTSRPRPPCDAVEVRDLAVYEQLAALEHAP